MIRAARVFQDRVAVYWILIVLHFIMKCRMNLVNLLHREFKYG
jgi:hypothetical protein